jgi:predicted Zn finger-like uncharacterized protein
MSDDQGMFEKRGNTTWVSCPTCAGWFHVADALVERGDIALRCTHCQGEFPPAKAKQIVRG